MAIRSGFFNSINGDRKYNANRFAEYFATFIGNGIFPVPSDNLQVIANNDMTVTVKAGKAWINGYIVINDDDYIFQIEPADGVLNRIDRIVARYNVENREITLEVKQGDYATNAVAKELQRDADAFELALADVLVGNGAVSITQANIADLRLNTELCGIVHGLVDQVDTTTLYNQYLSFWEDWRNGKIDEFEQFQSDSQDAFNQQTIDNQQAFDNQTIMNQQEFDDWFAMVQGILNGDVAGNLLDLIEAINDSKGQPNGFASLDDEGKVPIEELPPMDYVPLSDRGVPDGVATLDEDGKIIFPQIASGIKGSAVLAPETFYGYTGSGDSQMFTVNTWQIPLPEASNYLEVWLNDNMYTIYNDIDKVIEYFNKPSFKDINKGYDRTIGISDFSTISSSTYFANSSVYLVDIYVFNKVLYLKFVWSHGNPSFIPNTNVTVDYILRA